MGYRMSVMDSVSVGEMMHMRNVLGMSNGEIAERIGCCSLTVRRAIGPHPEGKRRARRKKEIPLPPPCFGQSAGNAESVFPAALRGGVGCAGS